MSSLNKYRLKMLMKNKKLIIKPIVFYTGIFALISLFLKYFLTGSVLFFQSDPVYNETELSTDISHLNENNER